MKFYGIFVVLLLVFHFSEQNELECWSCDDCKVIHPRHMRVEKCEMDMEQLVAASSEESMTAFPEMTTDFMDQDDQMTTVTEPEVEDLEMSTQGEGEEPEVQDYMTTMEGEEMEAETTTESMEETTTDFPVRSIVKRNAGPTAYCYKFSYQSGKFFVQVQVDLHQEKIKFTFVSNQFYPQIWN